MALQNYRDISPPSSDVGAGFQYEFYCSRCARKWKSEFRPYRMGQISGILARFAFLIGGSGVKTAGRTTGTVSDMGSRGAKQKALEDAMAQAEKLYVTCPVCRHGVCKDCFDADADCCLSCVEKEKKKAADAERRAEQDAAQVRANSCPNCSTPNAGGRFCAECGFDMASTHKTCPACGAMMTRQSRFCTDCGHSF